MFRIGIPDVLVSVDPNAALPDAVSGVRRENTNVRVPMRRK